MLRAQNPNGTKTKVIQVQDVKWQLLHIGARVCFLPPHATPGCPTRCRGAGLLREYLEMDLKPAHRSVVEVRAAAVGIFPYCCTYRPSAV